jgi:hypothetical protein
MWMLSGEVATQPVNTEVPQDPGRYLAHRPDGIGQLLLRVVAHGRAAIGRRPSDDVPGRTI